MSAAFTANIRGVPHSPGITEINARAGAGTTFASLFKAKVGLKGLPVLEVKADEGSTAFQGKVYQWMRLRFPDGQTAWVRDDLLEVVGNGSAFGYDPVAVPTFAFTLTRRTVTPVLPTSTQPTTTAASSATSETRAVSASAQRVGDSPDRVRLAAFNITAGFEGHGYATYQNTDKGIVSYGRFQFTLAGSALFRVCEKFTSRANNPIAAEIRSTYLERIRNHDAGLRSDARLKSLLLQAAQDIAMQAAQDEVATEDYWNVVQDLSIKPRGIRTPLGQALIFDMGINFGTRHGFIAAAEEKLGIPPRSPVGTKGVTEQQLITTLAGLRKESHDAQAARENQPGLRERGDFWVNLCANGDWDLMGDPDGTLLVKKGLRVKVRGF